MGGFALEVYTDGGYSTTDVDLALPNAPEVDAAFSDLGFAKRGRFWVRPELDLYFDWTYLRARAVDAGERAALDSLETRP